jgi:hypothetical protein
MDGAWSPRNSTTTNRRLRAPTDERGRAPTAASHTTEPPTHRRRTGGGREDQELGHVERARCAWAGSSRPVPEAPDAVDQRHGPAVVPVFRCAHTDDGSRASARWPAGRASVSQGRRRPTSCHLRPGPSVRCGEHHRRPPVIAVPGAQENRRRTGDRRCTVTDRSGTAPPRVTCHAGRQRAEDEDLPRRATWQTHSACPTGWAPLPCC